MKNGFSMDYFKKDQDASKLIEESPSTPYWLNLEKPTIVALYSGVLVEYERLKGCIEIGENIEGKNHRIVNSRVCDHAGVVKSYLRADRQDTKHILDFIAEKNEYLFALWSKKKALVRPSGSKPLKSEIEFQNKTLKRENLDLMERNAKEYFQLWIEKFLVNDSKRMVAKIVAQESRIMQLSEENIELKAELSRLRRQRNDMTFIQKPS